jgi:hypothetical protein
MGALVVAKCQRLPCEIRAYQHLPHHTGGASTFELALPFLITIFIILLTVATTNEVKVRGEGKLTEGWTKTELEEIAADRSPETYAQAFPWVVDAAQIPSVIGTPLVGLLVLRRTYQLEFIVLYLLVVVIGIMVFVHFLRKVDIYRYKDRGHKRLGYQVSPLALGGLALNTVAILVAIFVVK